MHYAKYNYNNFSPCKKNFVKRELITLIPFICIYILIILHKLLLLNHFMQNSIKINLPILHHFENVSGIDRRLLQHNAYDILHHGFVVIVV